MSVWRPQLTHAGVGCNNRALQIILTVNKHALLAAILSPGVSLFFKTGWKHQFSLAEFFFFFFPVPLPPSCPPSLPPRMPAELRIVCCEDCRLCLRLKYWSHYFGLRVCEYNRDGWLGDGGSYCGCASTYRDTQASPCLSVWEKIKRQQTQVGFYCQLSGVCLFTRVNTQRGASQASLKSAPAHARSVLFICFFFFWKKSHPRFTFSWNQSGRLTIR